MATPGKPHRAWWCLLFVLGAVAVPRAQQQVTPGTESLRVLVDGDWVARTAPGYVPIGVDLTNLGDARTIEIVAYGTKLFRTSPSGQSQSLVRQRVRLSPGDRVRLTLPVPVFADNEHVRVEVVEGNRTIEWFTFAGFQSRQSPGSTAAVIVADPASPFGAIADKISRGASPGVRVPVAGRGAPGSVSIAPVFVRGHGADLVTEPARLPTNWIGFTSVRAVVIGPAEWQQLTDAQKNALLSWTASGGDLVLVDGTLDVVLTGARADPAADPDRLVSRYFFGRVHAVTSAALLAPGLGLGGLLTASDTAREPIWALPVNTTPDWGAIEGRGFRLKIPGFDGVPARTFLVILFLFSIVIGPASYWFLRRKGQLVLLVLTAPLISLVSIGLLVGYALADDGFRIQGRAMTITMLDQASKQSATRATVSYYAPGLAPTGGLRFSRDVAVFPIGADGSGTRERMTVDLTDAQAITQGLLATRAPTNFEQVSFRPARERLTFSRNGTAVTVSNGLDAVVLALRYRDGDTVYTLNDPLPAGGQQTMTATAVSATASAPLTVPVKFVPLVAQQPAGSYLALLDRSPFWEPGTSSLVERGSFHLVFGWPDGQR